MHRTSIFALLLPVTLHAQMLSPNPCTLLTADEVLSATRDTVTKTSLAQFTIPECDIATSDSNATITIKVETTRDYLDTYWDVTGPDKTAIPSLGERAVATGTPPVTKVLRRGHVYTISYANATLQPDQILAREKALAFFAINRAP